MKLIILFKNFWGHLPDDGDDYLVDFGSLITLDDLGQALSLLVLSQLLYNKKEHRVEKKHEKNEDEAIIARFINSHDEEVPLHEQSNGQEQCEYHSVLLYGHLKPFEDEVTRLFRMSEVIKHVQGVGVENVSEVVVQTVDILQTPKFFNLFL